MERQFKKISHTTFLPFLILTMLTLIKFFNNKGMDLSDGSKYIGCSVYEAGGLGNQLWRFASLYGIGKNTNRIPYFESDRFKPVEGTDLTFMNLTEISSIFPAASEMFKIMNIKSQKAVITDFANDNCKYDKYKVDCCKYENPKKLVKIRSQFLKITGNYLQSYKFFENFKSEIKKFFQCSTPIMDSVKKYANYLFKNDKNSHKICVHIRRGDFLTDEMLESKSDFVNFSIDSVQKYFHSKNITNQSLLFIGDNGNFVKGLNLIQNSNKFYKIKTQSRGEDLCFGINFCDSMILTASGSTFGWWTAYLMKSEGPVFYISQVSDFGNHTKDKYYFDLFPPKWIKLKQHV